MTIDRKALADEIGSKHKDLCKEEERLVALLKGNRSAQKNNALRGCPVKTGDLVKMGSGRLAVVKEVCHPYYSHIVENVYNIYVCPVTKAGRPAKSGSIYARSGDWTFVRSAEDCLTKGYSE